MTPNIETLTDRELWAQYQAKNNKGGAMMENVRPWLNEIVRRFGELVKTEQKKSIDK